MSPLVITTIPHDKTWPLRRLVLRPGKDPSASRWPGDSDTDTHHYAACLDDEIVGICSLYKRPHDCTIGPAVWQLRGMAVHPQHRGKKIGGELLTQVLKNARTELSAKMIWCNAREHVVGLYERFGFEVVGGAFEIEGIGPHRVMRLAL